MDTMFTSPFARVSKNPSILTDMSPFGEKVRNHLVRVFLGVMVAAVVTSIGAWCVAAGFVPLPVALWGGAIGGFVAMLATLFTKGYGIVRLATFLAFAFAEGLVVGPSVMMVGSIDPGIVVSAAVLSIGVFAAFALAAMLAKRREYLFLGGFLSTMLWGMLFFSIVRMFVRLPGLDTVSSFVGLAIFSLYIVFDVQVAAERAASENHPDVLRDAISLHLDLINIFIEILRILARNREKKERRERK